MFVAAKTAKNFTLPPPDDEHTEEDVTVMARITVGTAKVNGAIVVEVLFGH